MKRKEEKKFQKFSYRTLILILQESLKRGKGVKKYKKYLAEHILKFPGRIMCM